MLLKILETILSATLGLFIFYPALLLAYLINEIIRLFVKLLLRVLYGNSITLSPVGYEGMFMYKGHPNSSRMVLYLATLTKDREFDIELHQTNYSKTILNLEEYQKLKKIWMRKWSYTCLREDENFNIQNHVRLYEKERIVSEDELMNKIMPELSQDMTGEDKPQWEDVIIPRFLSNDSPDEKVLRIFRVHHGYMDGISNLLMLANTQSSTGVERFPWVVDPMKRRGSKMGETLWKAFALLSLPGDAIKNLINSPKFLTSRWYPKRVVGNIRVGWSRSLDIKIFQDIKEQSGCSMPAILSTVVACGMKKVELHFGEERTLEETLIGVVAALLPYPDYALRNNHSFLKCYLNNRDVPRRARLWSINEEMNKATPKDVFLNNLYPNIFGNMPSWVCDFFTSFVTAAGVISNFPAAREKVQLWGWTVEDMAGWVSLFVPTGFACVTLRYANKLRFCINADEVSMSREQLEFFLKSIEEEAHLLHQDLQSRSKGSLIGRFMVHIVEDEKDEGKTQSQLNNNSLTLSDSNFKIDSRGHRLSAAVNKLISTMNKFKQA